MEPGGSHTPVDQRVDVGGAPRLEEDVALADAALLGEQARGQQRLPDRQGERALVAGKAPGEVGELRVVAAPFAHAAQPLEDPPGGAHGRVRIVVGTQRGVGDGVVEGVDGLGVGGPRAQAGGPLRGGERAVEGRARVGGDDEMVGQAQRPGAQAVDALELLLERQRGQVPVGAVGDEHQEALPGGGLEPRATRGHERADRRRDQEPGALGRGGRVGAQGHGGGRDGQPVGDADPEREVIARTRAVELGGGPGQLLAQRGPQAGGLRRRRAGPAGVLQDLGEVGHSVRTRAYGATQIPMEAATPLPFSQVRVVGDTLRVDGLVVHDECAVRLVAEHDDPAKIVADAIEIGARILDREQTGANAEFVKAEFEKAASELNTQFVDRARTVAEGMNTVITRHFNDDSSEAVQHKVRQIVRDVSAEMQKELRTELLSEGDANPLAKFHKIQLALSRQQAEAQAEQMRTLVDKLEATRLEVERLRAEKEKLEEVAAVEERSSGKGRTYEEAVAEAIESFATAQGDDSEAVGDAKEATGKVGDVVVGIDACSGPARGRIVFEAKNKKLSRPEALRELDAAREQRNADFAVLVVAAESKLPARMLPLREYNGDKMVVTYDPEEGTLALQVAYALARARVLMRKADAESSGIDGDAIRACGERALQQLGEVQRIRQQLSASKTAIDKADSIVGTMSDGVKVQLAEIQALVAAAGVDAAAEPRTSDTVT